MTAHPRRPDLHCHSNISDGTHAPAWLAQRAHSRGVDLWALTDHDEVGGVAEAAATARTLGLPFLPGVEISVTWEEKTIHIVGLGIDENHAGLLQGLQAREPLGRQIDAGAAHQQQHQKHKNERQRGQ